MPRHDPGSGPPFPRGFPAIAWKQNVCQQADQHESTGGLAECFQDKVENEQYTLPDPDQDIDEGMGAFRLLQWVPGH